MENYFPRALPRPYLALCQTVGWEVSLLFSTGKVVTNYSVTSPRFGPSSAYSNGCRAVPIALPGCAGEGRSTKNSKRRRIQMKTLILSSLNRLHNDEAGQGLVEYLLILALVAFAATAGMTSLASGLNSAFSKIGVVLGTYIK